MPAVRSFANDYIQVTYQALLSLNLAFAFSYAVASYNLIHFQGIKNATDGDLFFYYFFRSAVRINDFLHLHASNGSFGRLPNPGSPVGADLTFAITVVGIATILLLLLQLFLAFRQLAFFWNVVGTTLCLCAPPLAYLLTFNSVGRPTYTSFSCPWSIAAVEILCVFFMFVLCGWRRFHLAAVGVLLALHYSFWLKLLGQNSDVIPYYELLSVRVLIVIYVLSGVGYLLYRRISASALGPQSRSNRRIVVPLLSFSALGLTLLAVLWLPRAFLLVHARDPEALTIENVAHRVPWVLSGLPGSRFTETAP